MMKRKVIIPLFLLLSFYLSQAQLIMIDGETGEFKYEEVVQEAGMSKGEIQERAKRWLSEYYVSEDSVHVDSAGISRLCSNKIKWILIKKGIDIEVFFDVDIKFKDGKYKYAFSDFREGKMVRGELQSMSLKTYIDRFPQAYHIGIEEPIDSEITKAINSLKYYVTHGAMEKPEEDW
jgi:hypothetical protein